MQPAEPPGSLQPGRDCSLPSSVSHSWALSAQAKYLTAQNTTWSGTWPEASAPSLHPAGPVSHPQAPPAALGTCLPAPVLAANTAPVRRTSEQPVLPSAVWSDGMKGSCLRQVDYTLRESRPPHHHPGSHRVAGPCPSDLELQPNGRCTKTTPKSPGTSYKCSFPALGYSPSLPLNTSRKVKEKSFPV